MRWDEVHDSREVFLTCMRAVCAPGVSVPVARTPGLAPQAALDTAAAIALSLLGPGLTLAGVGVPRTVLTEAAQRTGADLGPVSAADWVLVAGPGVEAIGQAQHGTPRAPERGASIIVLDSGVCSDVVLSGPGVPGVRRVRLPLGVAELRALATANAEPPCGVDVYLVRERQVVALPRSIRISCEEE